MLKPIVLTETPEPVAAKDAADRFPPVLDNPILPVTRGSLARFSVAIFGKGRAA